MIWEGRRLLHMSTRPVDNIQPTNTQRRQYLRSICWTILRFKPKSIPRCWWSDRLEFDRPKRETRQVCHIYNRTLHREASVISCDKLPTLILLATVTSWIPSHSQPNPMWYDDMVLLSSWCSLFFCVHVSMGLPWVVRTALEYGNWWHHDRSIEKCFPTFFTIRDLILSWHEIILVIITRFTRSNRRNQPYHHEPRFDLTSSTFLWEIVLIYIFTHIANEPRFDPASSAFLWEIKLRDMVLFDIMIYIYMYFFFHPTTFHRERTNRDSISHLRSRSKGFDIQEFMNERRFVWGDTTMVPSPSCLCACNSKPIALLTEFLPSVFHTSAWSCSDQTAHTSSFSFTSTCHHTCS